MPIRQVVSLAGQAQAVKSLLLGLEQLGLQICDGGSTLPEGSEGLVIFPQGFETTPSGSVEVRKALCRGNVVLLDPGGYSAVLEEMRVRGDLCEETRRKLEAYALYRCLVSDSRLLAFLQDGCMPAYVVTPTEKVQDLRYGENWHQKAAFYRKPEGVGLFNALKLNGREMSYNNVVDAESVLEMLIDLAEYDGVRVDKALSVIVKHANPCGVAYGESLKDAYRKSFATDPKSAFGGVIGFNRRVDVDTAKAIGDSFVEVLLAPGYELEALSILTEKKPNRRILDIGDLLARKDELYSDYCSKNTFGGSLLQDRDRGDIKDWNVVTRRKPSESESRALRFAWKIAKYVKSNALVYTTEDQTIGIGSGQVSRVDSARFGAEKAEEHGLSTIGTVAATDSFFPFRDGLDETHKAGATAVVHPGGSIRDAEVIKAADEFEMAMVFTGMRHFRH